MRGHPFLMVLGLGLLLAAGAPPAGPKVDRLRPPAENRELVRFRGTGVQIYEAKATGGHTNPFAWTLTEPRADLFDEKGTAVGRHFRDPDLAGPAWEAKDGSKVVAAIPPLVSEPKPDAIPCLLLKAKTQAETGVFGKVTYIQRVDTVGGLPPGQPPRAAGEKKEVKYEATYIFWIPAAGS